MGARAEHLSWDSDMAQKRTFLLLPAALDIEPRTKDSSGSGCELVAHIRNPNAPEPGSGRVPGVSAINAAEDADGQRTSIAADWASITVAPGPTNDRQQSGKPHPLSGIERVAVE